MSHDMKKELISRKFIRLACACAIFLSVALPLAMRTGVDWSGERLMSLDGDWCVEYNNMVYDGVHLSDLKLPSVSQGDVVRMSCTIPKDVHIDGAAVAANYHNSAVEISVDDERIYSRGIEQFREEKFIGSGMHEAVLPENYGGKKLEICLFVGEKDAFSTLATPVIGAAQDIVLHLIYVNRTQLAISLFLMVFGLMLGLITLVMLVKQGWFFRLFAIAMFSILVGCWTLCSSNLMQCFVDSLVIKGWFEYMCVYVLPLPFLAYYYGTIRNNENSEIIRMVYNTMLLAHIVLIGVVLALHLTNTYHFPRILPVAHAMMGVDILLVIIVALRMCIHNANGNHMHLLSMGLIDIFVVFELLHYNLNKYVFGMPNGSYSGTICYGAMLVVFALMIDCCGDIRDAFLRHAKESAFEQMAYTDELTGLRNRRYFDREIKNLAKRGTPFGVVSMDMNHLKFMNDTYGHDMGDKALIQFSRVLEQVFSDVAVACRIGGDEFNVLVTDIDAFSFEAHQELLSQKLSQWNAKSHDVQLSTAIGYAASYEVDENADEWGVCRLADNRMYECKRTQKQIDFRLK